MPLTVGLHEMFTIEKNTLKALLLFAGKKDIRYYLNGVIVDGKESKLVASDGHRLITVKIDYKGESFIIPRELIENALKISNKHLDRLDISFNTDSKQVDIGGLSGFAVDGRILEWQAIIPTKNLVISPAKLNHNYYSDAVNAYSLIHGVKTLALSFKGHLSDKSAMLPYQEAVLSLMNSSVLYADDLVQIVVMPTK